MPIGTVLFLNQKFESLVFNIKLFKITLYNNKEKKMALNTAYHYNFKSNFAKCADFCLQPVRYCWNGKEVNVIDVKRRGQDAARECVETQSFPEKNFLKTALAIVTFIPGLILGGIARVFLLLSAENRKMYKASVVPADASGQHIKVITNPIDGWIFSYLEPHLKKRFPASTIEQVEVQRGPSGLSIPTEGIDTSHVVLARNRNAGAGKVFGSDGDFNGLESDCGRAADRTIVFFTPLFMGSLMLSNPWTDSRGANTKIG